MLPHVLVTRPLATLHRLAGAHLAGAQRIAASASSGASGSSGGSIFIIPNATFFVELIIFLVVFGVMARVILPPIQKVMREREDRVRSGLAAGDEGRAEADRLAAERALVLEQARAEARRLLEEASRAADAALEDARRRGAAEHEALLTAARTGLESERAALREELLGRLGVLVVDAASRAIGEPVTLEGHRGLIDELVAGGGA